MENPSIELTTLFKLIDEISKKHYGGHYTILKFTTHYKFSFRTITDREEILELTPYDNLNDAIENGIQEFITIQR